VGKSRVLRKHIVDHVVIRKQRGAGNGPRGVVGGEEFKGSDRPRREKMVVVERIL